MDRFPLTTTDGVVLAAYRWLPFAAPRGVVQIVHGMAEHSVRYDELARAMNVAGYAVYAHDLRGHGESARNLDELGYFGKGVGWSSCVDDVAALHRRSAKDFPDTPLFLLGHSMGSFLAQQLASQIGPSLKGLVLSGTYLESQGLAKAGLILGQMERARLGECGRSRLLRALTFDAFSRRCAPVRTRFDWLSRDASEVQKYADDPRCGFEPSVQLWIEVFGALASGLPLPPAHLPVCRLIGERDPVCRPDPDAMRLVDAFHRSGLDRIAHCVYPEARHELFHETNRAEVTCDLIAWLDQIVGGG